MPLLLKIVLHSCFDVVDSLPGDSVGNNVNIYVLVSIFYGWSDVGYSNFLVWLYYPSLLLHYLLKISYVVLTSRKFLTTFGNIVILVHHGIVLPVMTCDFFASLPPSEANQRSIDALGYGGLGQTLSQEIF